MLHSLDTRLVHALVLLEHAAESAGLRLRPLPQLLSDERCARHCPTGAQLQAPALANAREAQLPEQHLHG